MAVLSLSCVIAATSAAAASLVAPVGRIVLEAVSGALFLVGLGLIGADLLLSA